MGRNTTRGIKISTHNGAIHKLRYSLERRQISSKAAGISTSTEIPNKNNRKFMEMQ
jgi:hypothetical protein